MKSCAVASLVALVSADVQGSSSAVTPVQKVIQLMEGMLAKGKAEKQKEQVQYAAYKQFCDNTEGEKKRSIAAADEQIDVLKADIEKLTADAIALTKEIAKHDEDISVWNGDIKATTKVREIEKADYDATHKDYSESVDALERAIVVLKGEKHDRKQASLEQVSALKPLGSMSLIPETAKKSIAAFLSDNDDGLDVTAPEANAYEFQSQGVVDMLEKLLDKFIAERTDLEKEEHQSKSAFEMLLQDLTSQIARATEERDAKAATKAKKQEAKAQAEGDLTDTTNVRAEDQKYLDDMLATCEQKASDFESRQQLRAEELEAVTKAIEIIASGAVSGSADKHLPSYLQSYSLAQLRSSGVSGDKSDQPQANSVYLQTKVAQYLQTQSARLNSRVLAAIAVRAAEDPFVKVRKMIKDLIVRLMEEANAEAEHKGWCDKELATNEQVRTEKTDAVETLKAEIDELEASIAKGTEEISALATALSDLQAAMSKATELRQEEKETNAETVNDAQEAQTAVAQALTVLQEFYAKAGAATAFVQDEQTPPATFDTPYKGMQSENGGVVGMLEVIQSDFARLEAETKANEATSQKEYDTFMSDSKVDKESKETDVEHKTQKKEDESHALAQKKVDLEGTQKELTAALSYFDKLKPSCVNEDVSYEDRVARRKEEIESLQEALKILSGDSI